MKLKTQLHALVVAGALVSAGLANAYPVFKVDPGDYSAQSEFSADKITGNYTEVITFVPSGPSGGSFAFSLLWNAGQFATNNGTTALIGTTGLNASYGLYALFQGVGTYTATLGVPNGFTLTPGGTLNVYVDPFATGITSFTAAPNGAAGFGRTAGTFETDVLIATGVGLSGGASLSAPNAGFVGGLFGQITTFQLTDVAGTDPDGESFFVYPNPFFALSLESGQVNLGATAPSQGTVQLNGSLDVIFLENRIPEPSSLSLMGIAFVGLSLVARRRKNAKG